MNKEGSGRRGVDIELSPVSDIFLPTDLDNLPYKLVAFMRKVSETGDNSIFAKGQGLESDKMERNDSYRLLAGFIPIRTHCLF